MQVIPYVSVWGRRGQLILHNWPNLTLLMAWQWRLLLMFVTACIWRVEPSFSSGLSSLKCFRGFLPLSKHRWACCSLLSASIMVFLVMWSLQKFQRSYWARRTWRPSHTDVFRLCCCSRSVQGHKAREVIHDASFFLVTVSRHTVCSGLGVNTTLVVLVDFLLLRYNKLVKDWSQKWWIAQGVICRGC